METLVVVARHKNQYFSKSRHEEPAGFSPSPSGCFSEIYCRAFESGVGLLPNPSRGCTSPGSKMAFCSSPKSPSTKPSPEFTKHRGTATKTSASLPIKINGSKRERSFDDDFAFSELWAGPAYSNSPPPSSVPIPTFSLRQKRSVSLDLPGSAPVVELQPFANSEPSSPTREPYPEPKDLFTSSPETATRTLCRILNLNISD